MSATLLIIQHVPHERLGTFEAAFKVAGYALQTLNVYAPNSVWPSVRDVDGLIIMGGPQSVYEQGLYPYLTKEIALIKEAMRAEKPMLGVCLGAQLLAAALGAKVARNPQKEIGWHPLMREPGADRDPLFEPFGQTETVLQWHGDTFHLPKGAVQLASSPLCQQQAFRFGKSAYGLQFHVEVTEAMIRSWLRANRAELAALRGVIDPATIRQQTPQHIKRLEGLSHHIANAFCNLIPHPAHSRRPAHARSV